MKKVVLGLILLSGIYSGISQEANKEEAPKEGWKKTGNISLLFNQSSFNDSWQAGGTSSVAGNLGLNYDFNYSKDDITWDNKIIAAYGVSKLDDADFKKTDDRFEFNSILGKKAKGFWYYSTFFNLKTQLDVGDAEDADGNLVRNSHMFSPGYFQLGLGMLWKKSDNLKVNIAPATSKLVLVHDEFTVAGPSFGVEQGETTRFEFGAALGAYYKCEVMKNVSFEHILSLYSNYLEDPQNVDVDFTFNIVMKVNKYLSANFTLQTIYDDNAVSRLQVKEVFGAGVNVAF